MFERYTEKARRAIFFARYEAAQVGSPYIETEHLLLGILRENRRLVPQESVEKIRAEIEARTLFRERVLISVDLPLSNESKRVLAYGADEAERLGHRHIGTEHLVLGLLREHGCLADEILRKHGFTLDALRVRFANDAGMETDSAFAHSTLQPSSTRSRIQAVEIHGQKCNADEIRNCVTWLRKINWHWEKQEWKAKDIAVHRETGGISFDASLVKSSIEHDLVQGGWKKDNCAICSWELWEAKDDEARGTGYTNGRDWVCIECYEKFIKNPNFFSTSYPEIT